MGQDSRKTHQLATQISLSFPFKKIRILAFPFVSKMKPSFDQIVGVVAAILSAVAIIITGSFHSHCGFFYPFASAVCFVASVAYLLPFFHKKMMKFSERPEVNFTLTILLVLDIFAIATGFTFMTGASQVIPTTLSIITPFGIAAHHAVDRDNKRKKSQSKKTDVEQGRRIRIPKEEKERQRQWKTHDIHAFAFGTLMILICAFIIPLTIHMQTRIEHIGWKPLPTPVVKNKVSIAITPSLPYNCHEGVVTNLTELPPGINLADNGQISGEYTEAGSYIVRFEASCLSGLFRLAVADLTFNVAPSLSQSTRLAMDQSQLETPTSNSYSMMVAILLSLFTILVFSAFVWFIVPRLKGDATYAVDSIY
eukprot:TRINITY_DN1886_c0_g1_i1.p1 TRINITY_DN1886_c0_g1~~TRINITY_DN1886_c0_g1_i1.p1  ORF type:complete len:391 (-),score=72.53 TRINITY_DN1886_c0_g1_i1:271-1368(-)